MQSSHWLHFTLCSQKQWINKNSASILSSTYCAVLCCHMFDRVANKSPFTYWKIPVPYPTLKKWVMSVFGCKSTLRICCLIPCRCSCDVMNLLFSFCQLTLQRETTLCNRLSFAKFRFKSESDKNKSVLNKKLSFSVMQQQLGD